MGTATQEAQNLKKAMVKAVILAVFIIASIVVIRCTSAKEFLTPQRLSRFLDSAGNRAPLAFIMIYCAGVCLFVPGTALTALGAAIFGPFRGFIYVWVGAMLGACGAFLIGRYLGRDFAASLIPTIIKKLKRIRETHASS